MGDFDKKPAVQQHKIQISYWPDVAYFGLLHIAGIYGWWLFLTFQLKWTTYLIWWFGRVFITLGIGVGAHRLWSHKSFKAKLPMRIIVAIWQTMAAQYCIYSWALNHRMHHKYCDTDGDPHNSKRSFFFCHIGWLMTRKHPEAIVKEQFLDLSDLWADPVVVFQKKYYYPLFAVFGVFIPIMMTCCLGETLWNSVFGMYASLHLFTLHSTLFINSLAHRVGNKPFSKDICPTESMFVSIVTFGEGWHNYHHTFPWDYRAGELGSLFNYSTLCINLFAKIGWVYDLRAATPEMVAHRAAKHGDGTHPKYSKLDNPALAKNKQFADVPLLEADGLFGETADSYFKVKNVKFATVR